jgi:cobalt-zinc-cadmium efflux system membrane fusion protein
MKNYGLLKLLALLSLLTVIGGIGFLKRDAWLPWFGVPEVAESDDLTEGAKTVTKVIVNPQAQKNLGLFSKSTQPGTYWKTIAIPGMVVDRPGFSDRGIVAPASAVVNSIQRVPGDVVRPGEILFTLRLLSESLQLTQTDLFKSTQEITIAQEKLKRVGSFAALGTESNEAVREAENQIRRLTVATKAYRQELLIRGFSPEQIEQVADGKFVSEIKVVVPQCVVSGKAEVSPQIDSASPANEPDPIYEVQELKVELGQQVSAGQTLCLVANHRSLAIEGKAFRDETRFLERSVKDGWQVDVDFEEDDAAGWPPLQQTLFIRHIANSIDPATRTFAFLLPLENDVRTVERDGRTQLLWRFRPGQKLRLLVRAEKLDNVFVVPADGITQDGADVFIFTQNVKTFERKSVHLLLRDGRKAIFANDGSIVPGSFVAQSAAAQLNRMVKAGSNGPPRGYHIHADGSLHKNEDEGK